MCRLLTALWVLLVWSPTLVVAQSRQLGTNLVEVTDYSPQIPFNDLFLFSRTWLTQCRAGVDPGCTDAVAFDTGEASVLDLDTEGWVRGLPRPEDQPIFTSAATFWDVPAEFPAGDYVVLYEGAGEIEYGLGARKDQSLSSPGRDIVRVTPANGGILLRISATEPSNYLRNIRVVSAGNEAAASSATFRGEFLARLRPYSVLRFMDWMRTNNSVVSAWSTRAKPTDARYSTSNGVPVETMIELSNTSDKAPWFTLPHQANDVYLESFAQLTKERLAGHLPVYIEYSNEAWNSIFSQGSFMEQQGELEWPTSAASPFTKRINWYGKRSAQMCQIWKRVFFETPERVRCVIASQAANSWTATEALSCPLWADGPCAQRGISELAIAPYFGDYLGQEEFQTTVKGWAARGTQGLDALFTELQSGGQLQAGPRGGALMQSFDWISENREVARTHGLKLVAYEGGQHLVGIGEVSNTPSITQLFTSANRDSRMNQLYTSYLSGWSAQGGELFMHFTDISSYSRFGSWGALEKIADTASPKYDALMSFVGQTPNAPATPSADDVVTLSISRRGRGVVVSSVLGINCRLRCQASLSRGTAARLFAVAAPRARFVRWDGACRHSRRSCRVRMNQNQRLTAIFRNR